MTDHDKKAAPSTDPGNSRESEPSTDPGPPDPFDPARLALKGNPAETIGVKRVLVNVPVHKPNKQEFIRANPNPAYRIQMAILDLKTEGEIYAVVPQVAAALPGETRLVMLITCVSRQGNVFLWPVPLPSSGGRELAWHTTARQGATRAETVWIRIVPNLGGGAYDIYEAPASIGDPTWPEHSLQDLLRVAFGNGRLIDSLDHSVIKQLLGRA